MAKSPDIRSVVPADWKQAIEEAAAKSGQTVSQWVAMACYGRLPEKVRRTLGELNKRGKPKNE